MEKLKIIFVGIPDMALVCLANLVAKGFNIVAVVPPKKTNETYAFFKEFVLKNNLNLIDFEDSPNEEEYIQKLKELSADIGVVCSYNTLLSPDFLKTTKMGYINCHPSLLPDYRGGAPYFHIINNGEKDSGITLHFMDETFDTGDIIYQEKFPVLKNETMGTLFNRTTYMLSDALIQTLEKIQRNEKIERTVQNKTKEYKKAELVGSSFRIRWKHDDVFKIERLIRATNPFYNAFTSFRGVNFKIIKASVINKEHNFEYGKIIKSDNENLLIACKNGVLSVEIFQIGTWGIFTPNEFKQFFNPREDEFLI